MLLLPATIFSQYKTVPREHLLLDAGWRFAFGHPFDTKKDFDNGTGYFSYLAKAGFGDGAATANFDDRTWRKVDLPHDWAVEQNFNAAASLSHGFKAIGRNFPETSIGWYRKKITIPATDWGKHICIAFDGVYRNCMVWVNGHYLGTHPSGYLGVEYDITAYLNYGGENTIAVRADAGMEEGWFYEGAGIYRHVWLNKTNSLHAATNGTTVTSTVEDHKANVHISSTINNTAAITKTFSVVQMILDANGRTAAKQQGKSFTVSAFSNTTVSDILTVTNPLLWDIDNPYLYQVKTIVLQGADTADICYSKFGIRTIRFDNNEGFFLNGKHIKIKGTNNHQDHAGVGSALPDALQDYRIKTLKSFGSNAYRCSHNPPTPELLDACDRLGMLVIDENRLMGITQTHLEDVKKMIERDRNHPCIISWSIGNEEWGIENNSIGARIATTMQDYVHSLDSTRPATAAFSGGIGSDGITTVMKVLGINYIANKSTDKQHQLFPQQVLWGTEEGSTNATRGSYFRDDAQHIIPAYDQAPNKNFISIEQGWKHYVARDYLAGMFIWTGFDYRGEPTPYGWPSVTSYFGMVDLCGFAKDNTWYLKSWWTNDTVLHVLPHWNWPGKEGQPIPVWVYSNCDAVELFLNKKSLGKKIMPLNSHLEWQVNYMPGAVEAVGYKNGKKIALDKVQTTKEAAAIHLTADRNTLSANAADAAMITVEAKDKNGLRVPVADNEISFTITGPGKIIGVGNGNPTSLEPDKFLEDITVVKIEHIKEKNIEGLNNATELLAVSNNADWKTAFADERDSSFAKKVKALLYSADFVLPELTGKETITLFYNNIGEQQSIYVNGKAVALDFKTADKNGYVLDPALLHKGKNSIAIAATPLIKKYPWDNINTNPGLVQVFTPAPLYKRKLFNGLAQVIVQSTNEPGNIIVTASGKGLQAFSYTIETR